MKLAEKKLMGLSEHGYVALTSQGTQGLGKDFWWWKYFYFPILLYISILEIYFSVQAEVSKESHELPLLQQCRLCFHFMLPALQPNHTELEHHKMLLLYQLYMYIILVVSSCSNRPSFPAPLQNAKIPVEKRGTTNKTTWWKRRSKANLLKAAINYVNPTGWKSEFGKETKWMSSREMMIWGEESIS